MEQTGREVGPGTVRVGRFIGRLGVVAMPAIAVGLGIAERVVRRHVARLEAIGWLSRMAAVRGEGSLAWLTADGLAGVGLAKLGTVRAPVAFSSPTLHRVRVAWVAAELERHQLQWRATREMALDRQRWAITVANERGGHSPRLPDLAAWPVDDRLPVAVVLEHHQPNPRRQRAGLEAWQAAITAGQYTAVRYQTGPVTARQLQRVAAQIGLTAPTFLAAEQITADELTASLIPVEDDTTTMAATEKPPAAVSGASPIDRAGSFESAAARRHARAGRRASTANQRGPRDLRAQTPPSMATSMTACCPGAGRLLVSAMADRSDRTALQSTATAQYTIRTYGAKDLVSDPS